MSDHGWSKRVRPDCSIQCIISGCFLNPIVRDLVVIGQNSLRLLTLQSNQLVEVSRYDHQYPISGACLSSEASISFLSNGFLTTVSPSANWNIVSSFQVPSQYIRITCNNNIFCLSGLSSNLAIGAIEEQTFREISLDSNVVYDCTFFFDYLAVIEESTTYSVSIYSWTDRLKCAARWPLSCEVPYRLVSVPSQSNLILLSDGKFTRISFKSQWKFEQYPCNVSGSDRLIVDCAPAGVLLFLLTASGKLLSFNGSLIKEMCTISDATYIASLSLTRYAIIYESGRICLIDREGTMISHSYDASIRASSYSKGNFIVASSRSVYSYFIDFGFEIEKTCPISPTLTPIISNDLIFIFGFQSTVVLSDDFCDVTPSFLRNLTFSRAHAISSLKYFCISDSAVALYDHGTFTNLVVESDLSSVGGYSLFLAKGKDVTSYILGLEEKVASLSFRSQIQCVQAFGQSNLCVSLFSNEVIVLDGKLTALHCVTFDKFMLSLFFDGERLILGTSDGEVISVDESLEIKERRLVGECPVQINGVGKRIAIKCGARCIFVKGNSFHYLPKEFSNLFAIYGKENSYIALMDSAKKNTNVAKVTIADPKICMKSHHLYSFNGQIDRIYAARNFGDFAASFRNPPSMFWSSGDIVFPLKSGESVSQLVEWKAQLGKESHTFWVACVNCGESGRMLLLSKSRQNNSISTVIDKAFPMPLLDFAVISARLAAFVHKDSIVGLSLESGALMRKFTAKSPLPKIVAMAVSKKYLAILTNVSGFALYAIVDDSLQLISSVEKPLLGGRVSFSGDFLVISDRIGNIFVHHVEKPDETARKLTLCSTVCSLFPALDTPTMIAVTVCGEVFIIRCDGEEICQADMWSGFAFGHPVISQM